MSRNSHGQNGPIVALHRRGKRRLAGSSATEEDLLPGFLVSVVGESSGWPGPPYEWQNVKAVWHFRQRPASHYLFSNQLVGDGEAAAGVLAGQVPEWDAGRFPLKLPEERFFNVRSA